MTADRPAFSMSDKRAVIDIGSNSVRLVVYGGSARAPSIMFNEKVMAGLGSALSENGRIGEEALTRAVSALGRYRALLDEMRVENVRAVATAAARDAENGGELLDAARRIGFEVELLSGDQEARFSALGVLSAFPRADGLVADLGGGSLELARIADGMVLDTVSLPIGVLRIAELRRKTGDVEAILKKAMKRADWSGGQGCPALYLVGGSWRALARLHLEASDYPLRVIHNYEFQNNSLLAFIDKVSKVGPENLAGADRVSSARLPTLRDAGDLLAALVRRVEPKRILISSMGLRDGLLFEGLDDATRALDPLLVATAEVGAEQGRFPAHGRAIDNWMAGLFADDGDAAARIRRAVCNLADAAWRAHPEFRAERAVEQALHGNWIAIESFEREMMAQALFTTFGGGPRPIVEKPALASAEQIERAIRWGLAIRLAQRLSGGTEMPLENSILTAGKDMVRLELSGPASALVGEAVHKRLKQLARRFDKEPDLAQTGVEALSRVG